MLVLNLVGGWATPLKNMSSSIGSMIPNIWKNQKCSKPPTSNQLKPCHWHLLTHVHPFSRSQTRAAKNSRGRFYWRTLNRLSSAVADCMSVCPSYICSHMSREVEVPTARFGMETQRVRCGLRICFDCSSSAVQESTVQELEGSAPIPTTSCGLYTKYLLLQYLEKLGHGAAKFSSYDGPVVGIEPLLFRF